jgi:hypothetical protein
VHDDSGGARYLPPGLFIKIGDYKGALTYLRWFDRNFPDDMGFPVFLFEWTIVLFKRGKKREAEKKAFQTFRSNVHLFDAFFERPVQLIEMQRLIGFEEPEYAEELPYSHKDPELSDFSEWLLAFERSERFQENSQAYIDIKKSFLNTPPGKERSELIRKEEALIQEFGKGKGS